MHGADTDPATDWILVPMGSTAAVTARSARPPQPADAGPAGCGPKAGPGAMLARDRPSLPEARPCPPRSVA